ncbi:---NA--- [Paramuricea clavata]|uniref:---NA n=1 Tax=Paramuricea clavata TaxID=317549 RepID=A0A6S7J277_PARCT|nr:---NA--- [Paramuricea clavata]
MSSVSGNPGNPRLSDVCERTRRVSMRLNSTAMHAGGPLWLTGTVSPVVVSSPAPKRRKLEETRAMNMTACVRGGILSLGGEEEATCSSNDNNSNNSNNNNSSSDKNPHKCPYCDAFFKNTQGLGSHKKNCRRRTEKEQAKMMRLSAGEEGRTGCQVLECPCGQKVLCDICGKSCRKAVGLNTHKRRNAKCK